MLNIKDKKYWTILIVVSLAFIVLLIFDNFLYYKNFSEKDPTLMHREPKITTLLSVGDIMLSRNVGAKIDKANNPLLPFEKLRNTLSNPNITFGNLECPLVDSEIPIREGLVFRCLTKYVPGLVHAGFDVLSTANNHSFDQGENNLQFTLDYLDQNGIAGVGTGNAVNGKVLERNGVKFGFVAYSYTAKNDGGRSSHPGVATWNNMEAIKKSIENLKQISDVVILSIHAGTEYTREPSQEQINWSRSVIDLGADVVIGHHPHWIQTIEIYKNKPIFYSLGNFVFDQEWSEETKEGLMVKLQFTNSKLQTAELIPIIIENFCCPRLADQNEASNILRKIDIESNTIYFE